MGPEDILLVAEEHGFKQGNFNTLTAHGFIMWSVGYNTQTRPTLTFNKRLLYFNANLRTIHGLRSQKTIQTLRFHET